MRTFPDSSARKSAIGWICRNVALAWALVLPLWIPAMQPASPLQNDLQALNQWGIQLFQPGKRTKPLRSTQHGDAA